MLETERLRQREIHIEGCHRVLLQIDAMQRPPEVTLCHLRLVAAVIQEAHPHVDDIEILLLMALLDGVGDVVDLGKSPMESLVIHIIDHTVHPRTVVCAPVLVLLQIVHKRLVRLVEIRVAAVHLRLIEPLHHGLLFLRRLLGLLLMACRCLLGDEGRAHRQQNYCENNLLQI